MKKHLSLVFLLLLSPIRVAASEFKSYEMPGTHVIPIKDTEADRQYELYIKLPEGYLKNKDIKYPVIYMTDAVWHIEILSAATEFLMKDVILVGISWQKDINEDLREELGPQASRYRDYSIRSLSNQDHQARYQYGQASHHLTFIRNDVIQYIENNYQADPGKRAYFGYSLGGLLGTYILMRQPDTFKNYILGSPALSGDIPTLSKLGSKHKKLDANVFISFGSLEDQLGKHALEFVTLLKERKDKTLSVNLEVIEGDHSTAFPMTGVRSVTWLSNIIKEKK